MILVYAVLALVGAVLGAIGAIPQSHITLPPDKPIITHNITANETTMLDYVLAVENLHYAFYAQALSQFDEAAFNSSGFPPHVRKGYLQIARHKLTHLLLLYQTLGVNTSLPCKYTFPYINVTSFTQLSQRIENIATSAYIGALPGFKNTTYITAAASILAADARHASWIGANVTGVTPWSGPFDPPLFPDQILTLATPYIQSCPDINPDLPFRPFPNLTITPKGPPGSNVSIEFNATTSKKGAAVYATFLQGLGQTVVPIKEGGNVTLPANLTGIVYAVVTNSSSNATNGTIVAGPTVLEFH